MALLLELAKQVLFIYKGNQIVGCMGGKGQEVACQLFPAPSDPNCGYFVSPLKEVVGNWQNSREEQKM